MKQLQFEFKEISDLAKDSYLIEENLFIADAIAAIASAIV